MSFKTPLPKILISTGPTTTTEGAMAFLLVWETQNESALIGLTQSWFGMDEKLFAALAADLLWFTFLPPNLGNNSFLKTTPLAWLCAAINSVWQFVAAPDRADQLFLHGCPSASPSHQAVIRLPD